MSMSIGIRSLWIGIRAMNYTNQAFREVTSNTQKLKDEEKALEIQSMRMTNAGMMFIALGSMFALGMMNMVRASVEGSMYMAKFDQSVQAAVARIGYSLLTILKPALEAVMGILDFIAKNPYLSSFVAILAILGSGLIVVFGSILLVTGVMGQWAMVVGMLNSLIGPLISGVALLSSATNNLGIALLGVSAGFAIFFFLKDAIGPVPAAVTAIGVAIGFLAAQLWLAAIPMGMLTGGLAILGAGLAAGGLIYGLGTSSSSGGSLPAYSNGSRFVGKTGLALVHEGEEIRNNRRGMPSGVANSSNASTVNQQAIIDLRGSTIQTKADKEELRPFILKTVREAVTSK